MTALQILMLLVMVFKRSTLASDGFGYEVLITKMEYLDGKFETLKNETIQRAEQHQRVNSKILQALENLNKKVDVLQNEIMNQEVNRRPILEQKSKILQGTTVIDFCYNASRSTQYNIAVSNKLFEVYCEQELYDGGWIVIQNRFDGSIDFYRNWTEYRNGFGNLDGEFWFGLQNIYWLTSSRNYELLVHLEDFNGTVKYARYKQFAIGSENDQYVLKRLQDYTGTAGDSLFYNKGFKFSTFDRDNDKAPFNCAKERHGAWWYQYCTKSNLHGKYLNYHGFEMMRWDSFRNGHGLKISKMMIREVGIDFNRSA